MSVRIKICGITEVESARIAVAAGADAIGLMFYPPSKRYLELHQAEQISRSLAPDVVTVAVLVNPEAEYVEQILQRVRISWLQFHGDEPPEFCRRFGLPYIKSIRVGAQSAPALRQFEARYADAGWLLFDSHVDGCYGGTGHAFDWRRADYGGTKPIILAGGLDAENIAQALRIAAPWGVDVSSGVESDGRKDAQKIRLFCQRVRAGQC